MHLVNPVNPVNLDLQARPHFCSMKITQDVREYAASRGLAEEAALAEGMKEKAEEFVARGSEVYEKAR
jgi:phosphomethylpyrimidine synthase